MADTLIDDLREEKRKAERRLEDIKTHKVKRWENESFAHWFKRMRLHRKRRKNVRKIVEGYEGRIKDAIERKQKRKAKNEAKKNPYNKHGGGIVPFDSTVDGVVEWIAWEITEARLNGYTGYAFSGWRSPEKSEGLCYQICGAPSCPGRCAGKASRHAQKGDGEGAVDLTNPDQFEQIAYRLGLRLHNNLPSDLPHMSAYGN